jgi:hypothetical protein
MSEQVVNEAYSGIVRCEEEREPFAEAGFDDTTAHLIRLPAAGFEDISLCRPSKAFRRGCFPA